MWRLQGYLAVNKEIQMGRLIQVTVDFMASYVLSYDC